MRGLYLTIAGLALTSSAVSAYSRGVPKNFLWGASMINPPLGTNSPSQEYQRQDLALAHQISLNSVVISASWEKLEPHPGVYSENGLQELRGLLRHAQALRIKPIVVIHHAAVPFWFEQKGTAAW